MRYLDRAAYRRILMCSAGALFGVTLSAQAFAQNAQAPADSSAPASSESARADDIVVTARGRNEQLLNVPIAVNAFSSGQIADAKIDEVKDFITLIPNVNITQSESAGLSAISIRGLTQVRNSEAPVAVVVDGVLQFNSRQFAQQLFDLESIQVLRGPQGALYGRNATGGAIIITTRMPTDEFMGHLRAGYASGDEKSVEASVSGPIIPGSLRFRIGGRFLDRDGYFDNVVLKRKQDPYRDFTLRGLLAWDPTETLSFQLNGTRARTEASALNFHFQQALLNPDGTFAGFDFSKPGNPDLVNRTFVSNNLGRDERNIEEVSLRGVLKLPFATLTSVTGYSHISEYTDGDAPAYTASIGEGVQTQYTDVKGWSQELRLTSPSSQRFRWMLGGYYLSFKRFISTTNATDQGRGITRVYHTPAPASSASPTTVFLADDNLNQDIAGFGNIAYDIVPNLEASVALRYDKETRRQNVSPFNTSGTPGGVNRATFEKWQPKATLAWKPATDVNIYASYGVGFRAGQFNQNGTAALAQAAGIAGVADRVPQENTRTAEIGFKASLFDHRVNLSGALFHTDVENQQYFVFIGAVGAQVLVPIDKVRLNGGELEIAAKVADGLDVNASVGVTDSTIRKYSVNPAAVGNKAPYTPNVTFNAGVQYRAPITSGLGLFTRVDYRGLGKQYWDPENSAPRSFVSLVDARIGFEGPKRRWSITGTVENLFDKRYNAEFVIPGFSQPAAPRIWRIDLAYNF